MVSLNFTLLVELVLFLVFLWGTSRFVLRRLLRTLDEREETIGQNEQQAEQDSKRAKELEEEYGQYIFIYRREADAAFRAAKQEALRTHHERLSQARQNADGDLVRIRAEAEAQLEQARPALEAMAPEVAGLIAQRLVSKETVHG